MGMSSDYEMAVIVPQLSLFDVLLSRSQWVVLLSVLVPTYLDLANKPIHSTLLPF